MSKEIKKTRVRMPKEPIVEAVVDVPEETPKHKTTKASEVVSTHAVGKVVDCKKLNVRKFPSILEDVVVIIFVGSEVTIDLTKSKDDWYAITTATGDKGFVMKDYIAIKE